jgi:hypothetical protein
MDAWRLVKLAPGSNIDSLLPNQRLSCPCIKCRPAARCHRDISNEIRLDASGFRRDRQTGELVQALRLAKTGAASTGRVFLKLEGLDPSLTVNAVAPAASANDIVLPVVTNAAAVLKPDARLKRFLRSSRQVVGS